MPAQTTQPRRLLAAILFAIVFTGVFGTFYFSTSLSVLRPLVKLYWIGKAIVWMIGSELPHLSALVVVNPPVSVLCPSDAYESESFTLEIFAPPDKRIATPRHFWVKPPADISVVEDTGLFLIDSASWHLTAKEQGEYDILVGGDMPADVVKHVSVHRIDHLSRRQFTYIALTASVVAFISTIVTLRNALKPDKPEPTPAAPANPAESAKPEETKPAPATSQQTATPAASKAEPADSKDNDPDPSIPPT